MRSRGLSAGNRSGGSRPLPRNLDNAREHTNRSFKSRFLGNLATMAREFFPAMGNIAGAIGSDTFMRSIRQMRGDDASYGSQTWEQVAKPIGQSLGSTAHLAAALPTSLIPGGMGESSRAKVSEEYREFMENPGFSMVEHLGNAALVGSAVSKPLSVAARSAAGVTKPTRLSVGKGQGLPEGQKASASSTRAHRRQQMRDIEAGEFGGGAGLARAANVSRDIVGRPYTAATRGIKDFHPGSRHSIGEVARQVKESAPVRVVDGEAVYNPVEPVSPVAQNIRRSLDEGTIMGPLADKARNVAGPGRRLAGRLASQGEEAVAQAAARVNEASPDVRKAALSRIAIASRKEIGGAWEDPGFSPLQGKGMARRWEQLDPTEASQVAEALSKVPEGELPPAITPEMRAKHILDLEEVARGMDPGTLHNRLLHDAALSPEHGGVSFADALRRGASHLEETGGPRLADQPDIHAHFKPEGQATADLGISPHAQAALEQLRESHSTGPAAIAQEMELARSGGLVERMAPVLKRDEQGGWRAPEPGETPTPMKAELSDRQIRKAERMEGQIEDALAGAAKIEDRAAKMRAGARTALPATIRAEGARLESIARRISRSGLKPDDLQIARAEWDTARAALEQAAGEAGVRIPSKVNKRLTELRRAADADVEVTAGRRVAREGDVILEVDDTVIRRGDMLADPADADLMGVVTDAQGKVLRLSSDWQGTGKKPVRAVDSAALKAERARRAWQEDAVKMEQRAAATLANAVHARNRVNRLEDKLQAFTEEALLTSEAAPPRARTFMEAQRQAGAWVENELRQAGEGWLADALELDKYPATLEAMNNEGAFPGHVRVVTEYAPAADVDRGTRGRIRSGRLDEVQRRELRDVPDTREVITDFDEMTRRADIDRITTRVRNETVDHAKKTLAQNPDTLLGRLYDADALKNKSKVEKADMLHERGFVEWRPDDPRNPVVGSNGTLTPEASWMHESVAKALTDNLDSNIFNSVNEALVNPAMRGWKSFVLATRPAWQLANIVSNGIMAMWRGQIGPVEYMQLMSGPAQQAMRRHSLGLDPAPLVSHDTMSQVLQGRISRMVDDAAGVRDPRAMQRNPSEGGLSAAIDASKGAWSKTRAGYSNFVTRSYALNNFADNLNRTTVMLANAGGPGGQQAAMVLAQQALGDYTKMSRIERQYVKSIFPFWAWQRHIAKLTATSFAPQHLTRTTMAMHLMHLANEPDEWRELLNPYEEAMVGVGGTGDEPAMGWQTRRLNPFGDAFEMISDASGNLSPLGGMGRQAGPIPQIGLERLSGVSSFTGRPFTSAVPELDQWNREKQYKPGLARHALENLMPPQGRMAQDYARAAVGAPRARYDSGEPIVWEDAADRPLWDQPMKMLGVDIVDPNLAGRREAGAKGQARTLGRLSRYEQDLERARSDRRVPTLGDLMGRLTPGG